MRRLLGAAVIGGLAIVALASSPVDAGQGSCGMGYAPVSNPPSFVTVLSGVSGSWAVGSSGQPAALIDEATNGTWAPVNNPAPPNSVAAELSGVDAFAANDVWAVGGFNGNAALIEHWNGSFWSIVAGAPEVTSALSAVAVNPRLESDVWAVGGLSVEQWNGSFWSVVGHVPHGGVNSFEFTGVSVTPTGHVWVVGRVLRTEIATPWIDFFNGKRWSQIQGAASSGALTGVATPHDDSVWISGGSSGPKDPTSPFIEHWDGSTWSMVSLPVPAGVSGQISSISAADGNVWAAGSYNAVGSSNVAVPIVVVQRLRLPWIGVPTSSFDIQQFPSAIAGLPRHGFEAVGLGIDAVDTRLLFAISGGCVE